MYEAHKKHGTDQELIEVLTAISVVSKRLAMKLALIQSQSTEGGKQNEQNERYGCDHRRTAAAAINDAANWLAEMFSGAGDAEPTAPAESALTLEQVRAVLADKSRQGHTAEIRSLLQKYGAAKLSQIDPAHYKALLADAEVLTNGK